MFDSHYEQANFPRIREDWLGRVNEVAIEPDLPIVDPHHHLWDVETAFYHAPELVVDVTAGHRVLATVFVECKAHFDMTGPAHLASVGETRFAVAQAHLAMALRHASPAAIAGSPRGGTVPMHTKTAVATAEDMAQPRLVGGIVAYGDIDVADPHAVLEAHIDAGDGRLRGVRVRAAWHGDAAFAAPADGPSAATITSPALDRYCAILTEMGLTLDLWVYHTQLDDAAALARRHPRLTIILNHCGGPLGIGPYAEQHDAVFAAWSASLANVAKQDNVVVKIGGLAMPRTGMSFAHRAMPATARELVARWSPYVETCIALFGPTRAMFESNFPVDKGSCSYVSLWNAFKLLTAAHPAADRHALLCGTADRVYRLGLVDMRASAATPYAA
jgi:predicted TIM-barrel fold metal-dependent hydrolase